MKTIQWTLLVASLWASSGYLGAQHAKVDSLLQELHTNTTADQAEMLWGVAYELFDVDNVQALFYCRRAYERAKKQGDSLQIVKVGTTFGQLLRRMDRVDESIAVSFSLLPISKRHHFKKYTKMLLNSLALAYTFNDEYDKALALHFESLRLFSEDRDLVLPLANIGLAYYKLGDSHKGLEYYLKASDMQKKLNGLESETNYYYEIGACYNELGLNNLAMDNFKKELSLGSKVPERITLCENGIGDAFFHLGNMEEAIIHLKNSYKLSVQERNQRIQIANLLLLGEIYLSSNKLNECESYLGSVELLPALTAYKHLQLVLYQLRARMFSKMKNFENSSLFYEKYITLRNEIFGDEMNKRLRMIEVEFSERENLTKIESQSKLLSMQEDAISKQWWLTALSIFSSLLLATLTIVLLKANKRKTRINKILDLRVQERTAELEQQRDNLRHGHEEQVIAVHRFVGELSASLATLKGLSYAALKDLPQKHDVYFREAEATAEKMTQTVVMFKVAEVEVRKNLLSGVAMTGGETRLVSNP